MDEPKDRKVSIIALNEWKNYERAEKTIKSIFFESSMRKTFADENERESFYKRWTEIYLTDFQEQIFIAVLGEEVVGYLMGCHQSLERLHDFTARVRSYSLFEDLFTDYPAHLHINLTAKARGHGVGSHLIEHYKVWLQKNQISGLHLVTSPDARNVSFYRKNGFGFTVEREFSGNSFLFMGQKIPKKP